MNAATQPPAIRTAAAVEAAAALARADEAEAAVRQLEEMRSRHAARVSALEAEARVVMTEMHQLHAVLLAPHGGVGIQHFSGDRASQV
jgi:hypothetical protein